MCDRCAGGIAFFGLAEPQDAMLEGFAAALRSGWSPNNLRNVSAEMLRDLEADPAGFIARLVDPAGSVTLPDGTVVPRLPFRPRWMWDGDFCGVISLRWQPGTDSLPPYTSGHIGYAVVPWKRNHGYASRALRQILDEAREVGLTQVEITIDPGNIASRTVAERNGAIREGVWSNPSYPAHGTMDRYVIKL